ncbi:18.6 kDa class III heat shock protein [Apostasia shenzhenica]|uniref:18.6 kDa class III heat shock protein n=1 Tax=Apostasia shenzhenica TaxID=1088818 RepID=A0A2H9ZUW6_9ASPA|nr:18.6 kDa class III heat shock protein [Apostasia shenzhenica]
MADSILLDSAVSRLLNLPETLDRIAGFTAGRGHDNRHASNGADAGSGMRVGEEKGFGSVPVDILETSKSYTFFLDVPGLPKSEIQVTLEDDQVLIVKSSGKRKLEDGEDEGCKYLRLERKSASPKFIRKFRLPEDANSSAITAKCEEGVLTVVVEKLPPAESKSKTVKVAID